MYVSVQPNCDGNATVPSPFPGMDPFLEIANWEVFHYRFVLALSDALIQLVRPRYVVEPEKRVYIEHRVEEYEQWVKPDVTVTEPRAGGPPFREATSAVAAAAVECVVPMPVEREELFLKVLDAKNMRVVTVIELLSPSNKRGDGDGRREYLTKRDDLLQSPVHIVEVDLLRGGKRLPTVHPLPAGDYYAFVLRRERRPRAQVYTWDVRQPLPTIPIPLAKDDPDVLFDLQSVFVAVYDRSGYDYTLDYTRPLAPPLRASDDAWLQETLREAGLGRNV